MSDYNRRLGQYGEKLAAQFLIRRGWKILDQNFYTAYGEIDLIARQGDELLFVEVKTRTDSAFGYPETAVDARKISHLTQAARIYLDKNNLRLGWRLEIISIEIDKLKKIARINRFSINQ